MTEDKRYKVEAVDNCKVWDSKDECFVTGNLDKRCANEVCKALNKCVKE